ncbi:MAG: TIGR00153 family protein [Gammaproteobacteria bacterium]|nr:TIGR00153 family protein [Pseudomonadota bacterium]MCZ6537871.1 TIGR00153 family protein [Gammaproteobacteria bacterium]MCZ6686575.1 TIGR00153 family protein [Gammaproteobacteria bacterium]MCZ6762802.1 TIGR00153 family protein [Gammaproteobacteria bacterium]MCZ6879778.1 TIGR00153 family protein [Gammaproteobacteria bacterium]
MANYLSGIFGSSPVAPLQQHMDIAYRCAKQLIPMFEAVIESDWAAVEDCRQRIRDLESEADEMKQAIRASLPKSLFMPVPREDLLELLLVQDRVANRAKDVSGLVVGRKMELPDPIAEPFIKFVRCSVAAAKQARKSVRELDELFETGFRGAEAKLVASMVAELDRLESESDLLQSELRAKLFELESGLPPINVMFLYKIIDLTGEVADYAERVGRRLELLLAH